RARAGDEPILVVERLREQREDARVAILVLLHAAHLAEVGFGEVRGRRLTELDQPREAEGGGALGIDVELAEAAERAVAEMLPHLARHLAGEQAELRADRCRGARERRVLPAHVLADRGDPAA